MSKYTVKHWKRYGESEVIDEAGLSLAWSFDSATAERIARALEILDRIDALPFGSGECVMFCAQGPIPQGTPAPFVDFDPSEIEIER